MNARFARLASCVLSLAAVATAVSCGAGRHAGGLVRTPMSVADLDLSTPEAPEVSGAQGVVTSGPKPSVDAGMEMLLAGGNAADAAAATLLSLSVTESTKFCFGGEVPMIVYEAKTGKTIVLNGQGKAPALATIEFFRAAGGIPVPGRNESLANDCRNATVPASFHAILTLLDLYGTRTFEEVARPAARILAGYREGWQADFRKTFSALVAADVRARASGGSRSAGIRAAADEFYGEKGGVARRIVEWSEKNGALLRAADLAMCDTPVEEPVSTDYRGFTVHKCGPWTQGPYLLETLNILEGFDLKSMGRNSAAYIHTVVEALKLGLADRDAYLADPAFAQAPLAAMLSKDYAALRRGLIDMNRASLEIRPGDPANMRALLASEAGQPGGDGPKSDTTTCITADRWGNVVVATPSGWGGALAGDTGVWLNSRLSSLNTWEGHPNVVAPGKRPRITLTPTLVTRDGRPVIAISIAGGDAQDQLALEMFLATVEFNVPPGLAVTDPRFGTSHMTGSFGQPAPKIGSCEVNAGVGAEVIEGLKRLGHNVDVWNGPYWTTTMMTIDPATGRMRAAGDPAAQRHSAAY